MKNEEIELLNIQMIATTLGIATFIISILLTYNEKLKVSNLDPIYNSKDARDIAIFNHFFVFCLALVFLYVSFKNYQKAQSPKSKNSNSLELLASSLFTISSLIALYVVITDEGEDGSILAVENPII